MAPTTRAAAALWAAARCAAVAPGLKPTSRRPLTYAPAGAGSGGAASASTGARAATNSETSSAKTTNLRICMTHLPPSEASLSQEDARGGGLPGEPEWLATIVAHLWCSRYDLRTRGAQSCRRPQNAFCGRLTCVGTARPSLLRGAG